MKSGKSYNGAIKELCLIGLIGLVALVFRLWKIDQYLTFLGDEGRDVRIVRDLLGGNLVFIGPMTSIGNMYLGPLYYYMMAPFLWLARLNPVGPAIGVALLSTASVLFTWWVGRKWFGPLAGLLAALLFAISPVAIIYSRSSWNPNPMPFFALLAVWSVWQIWQNHKFGWLPVIGVSIAASLQMHYLGLLLVPVVGVFWIMTARQVWGNSIKKRELISHSLGGLLWFVLLMSPLVLFDIKHQGQNFKSFQAFFGDRQTTVNLNPARSDRFLPAIESVVSELLLGRQNRYVGVVALIVGLLAIWRLLGKGRMTLGEFWKAKKDPGLVMVLVWIGFGILGLGIYKQHIYAHYFGFLFPAVYLLVGNLLAYLIERHWWTKPFGVASLAFLIAISIQNSPLRYEPNRQLQRTEQIVDLIIEESRGEEFNFGLIAKQNYDESYRYFLENKKARLVRGEDKVVEQLFVVCEDGDKCQPEGNPQWQIAVFGPSHVDQAWSIDHIKVYRLIHTR